MGNRIGKRRQVVDEKYTRPQGAYPHRDIDHKKLRKLILECKLAPCYPGSEECFLDQEECPICFLYYPSLNRSRCCLKGICTECFLQMKPSHSSQPTQCPYCKTSNYAVEYRGERTREERGLEQIEEQKVIEAQIKVRHQEIQDEQERMKRRQELCSSNRVAASEEFECHDDANSLLSAPSHAYQEQGPGFVSSRSLTTIPVDTQFHIRQHRSMEEHFDMDLEELMVMEAIWLSIQEQESQANDNATSTEVASMAGEMASVNNHLTNGWLGRPIRAADDSESSGDNCSEVAEAGTSYAGSDIAVMDAARCACLLDGLDSPAMTAHRLLPESFEEQQMVVAMAVSLAESRLAWM